MNIVFFILSLIDRYLLIIICSREDEKKYIIIKKKELIFLIQQTWVDKMPSLLLKWIGKMRSNLNKLNRKLASVNS